MGNAMTEEEAKKTRCCGPVGCGALEGVSAEWSKQGHLLAFYGGVTRTCIGSNCMAWRWSVKLNHIKASEVERGYCGLAGEPKV